jgi:two-component system, OmpR family, sensor histidine kinase KdpD
VNLFNTRKYSSWKQYLISLLAITVTALGCAFAVSYIGYRGVALVLLLVVSLLAILFDIFPVLLTALLSALIWNFFFIPPTFTLHIGTPEDGLMFLMYFVIALINAVLTFKIRETERSERDKIEKEKTITLYNTLLNSLSHELRTPIATILGAIDTITDNDTKLSESNKHELHSAIAIAGLRLNRQVENLLSMSKLEAGILKPKPDWCDINELIFEVMRQNSEEAKEHQLVFNPDDQLPLYKTDRVFLEQVLHNIIHNALQHTPPATILTLITSFTDDSFCIIISDNGKGFPTEEIDLVFDKFYRLSNSKTGGTGLGLSIAKGFVEALNGSIHLENLVTGGAKFTIEIAAQSSPIKSAEDE